MLSTGGVPKSHSGSGRGGWERVARNASFAEPGCQVRKFPVSPSHGCLRLKGVSDFGRQEAPYLLAELTEVREPVGGYVRLAEEV